MVKSISTNFSDIPEMLNSHDEQLADIAILVINYKTSSNSWSDALQAAINYAVANNIKRIKLPAKTDMVLTNQITNNGGTVGAWDLVIEGDGIGVDGRGTCLTFNGNGYGFINDLSQPSGGDWRGITFKNMSIRTTNTNPTTSRGIKLIGTQQALFEKVEFIGLDRAVTITGDSHYPLFIGCKFNTCNNGIYIPESADADYVGGGANHGKLMNCFFTYCNTPIYQQTQGYGWTLDTTDLEGFNGETILGDGNKFVNVRMERNNNNSKWLQLGNYNSGDILMASSGGAMSNPFMDVQGNYNDITLSGTNFALMNSIAGISNQFTFKNLGAILDCVLIQNIDKSNVLKTIGNHTENLVNQDLTTWTKSASLTINNGSIADGKTSYQLVSNASALQTLSTTITGNFPANSNLFLTFDSNIDAGGGFYITIDGYQVDIASAFSNYSQNKKTILAHTLGSAKTSITITFGLPNGTGTAIEIGNVVVSSVLNSLLFA